jgi:predicted RNA binding protein YcfA (HicA-like mRNA interferase family)
MAATTSTLRTSRICTLGGRHLRRGDGDLGRPQHGSHARLHHPDRRIFFLTAPLHREPTRVTLSGILADAGLDADDLREL